MSVEPNLSALTNVIFYGDEQIKVHHKETSQEVLRYWDEQLEAINAIIQKVGVPGSPASSQITQTETDNFNTALSNLIVLAQDGLAYQINVGTPPVAKDVRDVITVEMAQDLDNLLRTVESASTGTDISGTVASLTLADLRAWRDFAEATPVINQIVTHMNEARAVGGVWNFDGNYLDGVIDDRGRLQVGSLQSMIELLYVKTGNELMAANLEQLEAAIASNKTALESLTALQSLHNNLTAFSKGDLPVEVGTFTQAPNPATDSLFQNAYNSVSNEFFKSVNPELGPGMASMYEVFEQYQAAAVKVYDAGLLVDKLEAVRDQVQGAFNALTGAGPEIWDNTTRSNFTRAIFDYRQLVVPYNNAAQRLNALIEPFEDLLNTPNSSFFDLIGLTPDQQARFPIRSLPVIPDFGSDQIPFTATDEVPSSQAARLNFANQLLAPFMAKILDTASPNAFNGQIYTAPNPPQAILNSPGGLPKNSTDGSIFIFDLPGGGPPPSPFFPPISVINLDIDEYATALYSQTSVISGNSAAGASPVAIIDMGLRIQKQYQLLQDQVASLAADPVQANNPNTLLAQLNQVIADLKRSGIESLPNVAVFAGLSDIGKKDAITALADFGKKWILDGLETQNSATSGKIQENLGFAIAAAESLNDQQKEETRRFLFLFEEFYKSASAMLTKITELIQKMAQNINR